MQTTLEPRLASTVPALRSAAGHFGWRIVGALFLCVTVMLGVAIYGFIMFSGPLSQQFGWSASQTGNLVSAMWLVGPLALVAAPVIERVGAWRLVAIGMLLQVVVLVAVGFVSEFWQLYLLRMTMGLGKIAVMTAAPVIVARWFDRRFATAMSIVWSGGAMGGILLAPLTQRLTEAVGWRQASFYLAAGLLAAWLGAALIARGPASPAEAGCGLDGRRLDSSLATTWSQVSDDGKGWTDTIRQMNWGTATLMCAAVMAAGIVSIALQSQEPEIFARAGLSPATAAAMLGVTAGACLVGSIAAGWMLDRLPLLWCTLSVAASVFGGLLTFGFLTETPNLGLSIMAAAIVGYALGAGEVVWITLFKRQFGVAAFPTTYGIFYFSLQLGFAAGGLVGGWSMDHIGLHGFLLICALLYLAPAALSIWRPGGKNLVSPA